MQTAAYIKAPKEHWKALNEIDAGVCEGLTYKEIEEKFPDDFRRRDLDKYHYRYQGGESYADLVNRLEPVILELEQQENVFVICHQAIARCLLAYFLEISQNELPYMKVPLHTVIKLTPIAYGCRSENIPFSIDAVDTHRPRPPTAVPLTLAERKMKRKMDSDLPSSGSSSTTSLSTMDRESSATNILTLAAADLL
jgi:broad specificity phosphatase PhoE